MMAATGATRRLRYAGLAAVVALVAIAGLHPASRARFEKLVESASIGRLPELTSFRVMPAATAIRMFLERPLVGVGPGSFSSLYMGYKLKTDEAFPQWIRAGGESFGQAHNDHLQVLAETGLPGYALFIAALVMLGAITFRRGEPPDDRARFARAFAFPGAAAFATLALAQFPLQVTAPMVPALFLGALCFAWTRSNESA
jgi:O-antigen ligase